MTELGQAKLLSVARHMAGGTGFGVFMATDQSVWDFFAKMTMGNLLGLTTFIATIVIAVLSKDGEALKAYQRGEAAGKAEGTAPPS